MAIWIKQMLSATQLFLETSFGAKFAGVVFTLLIAGLGFELAKLPGFTLVGPLACAIMLAVCYRQIWGYPEQIREGIQFSAKKLLRAAIVLFGLKLNMAVAFSLGLTLLLYDAGTIVFSILLTLALAKLLKADMNLALLLGVGTGVCGAAAIAAVAPIVKAKDEDAAIGVGMIALIGTIFAVGYSLLRPFTGLTDAQYGIWAGISLHELAHVALAAAPAGQEAFALGLLAKLGRVLLLVPLSLILLYWMRRKEERQTQAGVDMPWFLGGFIAMSLLGSYVLGTYIRVSPGIAEAVAMVTTLALTMAMVGLGLNVSLRDLKEKAVRPLVAMTGTSILLSIGTFYLQ